MRFFINTFLLIYFVDAGISVADEILIWSFGSYELSELRDSVANITLAVAAATYALIAVDCRIPKRIILPLIGYLFAISLFASLLGESIDRRNVSMVLSIGQLLISIAIFIMIRSRFSTSFLLGDSSFQGAAFHFKHTSLYLLANVLLVILTLPFIIYFLTLEIVSTTTGNFLRVDTQGVYLTEKYYQSGTKKVYLIQMVHVAEAGFYAKITDALASEGAIFLAEGVTDDRELLTGFRGTGKVAELLGLNSQATMEMAGDHIEFDQIADSSTADPTPSGVKILRADIDSSELSPKTVDFLNAVGRNLDQHERMLDVFRAFYSWSNEHLTAADQDAVYTEILDKRNVVLLRHLAQALRHFDEILIPWGALHMPTFETYLNTRGFNIADQRERRAISFWKDETNGLQ